MTAKEAFKACVADEDVVARDCDDNFHWSSWQDNTPSHMCNGPMDPFDEGLQPYTLYRKVEAK